MGAAAVAIVAARSICVLALLAAAVGSVGTPRLAAQVPSPEVLKTGAAAVAKIVGSAVFLSGRTVEDVLEAEFATEDPISAMLRPLVRVEVDPEGRFVDVSLLGMRRRAVLRGRLGVAIVHGEDGSAGDADAAVSAAAPLALPPALDLSTPWPVGDADARAALSDANRAARLRAAVDKAFVGWAPPVDPRTRAVLVAQGGVLVAERYAAGFTARTRQHGWSMTKSVVDALVGIRSADGELDLDGPVAALRQWAVDGDDPRAEITVEQMLRMQTGLRWREAYDGLATDPVKMLFTVGDAAAFAGARDLEHAPGTHWAYSSGTSNLICRALRESFVRDGDYHAAPYERLFAPLGMHSALVEADPSGTFVGSSLMYASARDWLRFGLFYLRDGVTADGRRILPEGWVAASTTPTVGARRGQYGRAWWLNSGNPEDPRQRIYPSLPRDLYYASGYEGQSLVIVPSRDAVILRLGCTKTRGAFEDEAFLAGVLAALP